MTSVLETVETDVLVLGGGVAGHRAAVAARELGRKVLLAYPAHGASPFLLGVNAPLGVQEYGDSEEAYFHDVVAAGEGLNDRPLVRTLASQASVAFRELDALGVPFARDKDRVLLRHLSGNAFPRSLYVPEGTGRALLRHLDARCRELEVRIHSGWRALTLLVDGGSVVGAVLVRRDPEQAVAVRAAAVVLATGGIGRLYHDSTYPADVLADSYALAARAGAALIDMEFVQFEPLIVVHPAGCRGMEIPTAMLGDGAHLLNAQGERFMFRTNPAHGELLIEKGRMALAIQAEIDAGRGLPDGTVWVDTTVMPRPALEGYLTHCRRLRAAGLDPALERPRIRPAAHSLMGGVRIDPEGWSGIPGLYAGGEAAGGVHGASRIAGNSGADVVVFGAVAGRGAAGGASSARSLRGWNRLLEAHSLASFRLPDGEAFGSETTLEALRTIMSRHLGLSRDGDGLRLAADALRGLEQQLQAASTAPAPSWAAADEALRVRNALLAARMIAESALRRTESRGAHQRRDHPTQDDPRWLRHIACRLDDAGTLILDELPIRLTSSEE